MIDAPTATLIAAAVAAAASILNLVLSSFLHKSAEERAQYRGLLQPHIETLGYNLHQLLATATVAMKRAGMKQPIESWMERNKKASDELKLLLPRLKYPLWGIDSGIRELTRLHAWLEHSIKQQERRESLLESAEILRKVLDIAIRNSFMKGEAPGLFCRWRVNRITGKLRKMWNQRPLEDE